MAMAQLAEDGAFVGRSWLTTASIVTGGGFGLAAGAADIGIGIYNGEIGAAGLTAAGILALGAHRAGALSRIGETTAKAEVADGLIYLRTDTTGKLAPYLGQTTEASELARQAAHARAYPNSRFEFETLESGIPKGVELDIAEHNAIQARTGGVAARRSSAVSNQRDPVGPRRRPIFGLPEPK